MGERNKRIISNWDQAPIIMDLPYAALLLGRSTESLKKHAQRGTLPGCFKLGNEWRVDKSVLMRHTGAVGTSPMAEGKT